MPVSAPVAVFGSVSAELAVAELAAIEMAAGLTIDSSAGLAELEPLPFVAEPLGLHCSSHQMDLHLPVVVVPVVAASAVAGHRDFQRLPWEHQRNSESEFVLLAAVAVGCPEGHRHNNYSERTRCLASRTKPS